MDANYFVSFAVSVDYCELLLQCSTNWSRSASHLCASVHELFCRQDSCVSIRLSARIISLLFQRVWIHNCLTERICIYHIISYGRVLLILQLLTCSPTLKATAYNVRTSHMNIITAASVHEPSIRSLWHNTENLQTYRLFARHLSSNKNISLFFLLYKKWNCLYVSFNTVLVDYLCDCHES